MNIPESLEKANLLRQAGKFQDALHLLESIWEELGTDQTKERIACLHEQSQCLWRSGQLGGAERRAQEALQLAEEAGDLLGLGNALSNLGVIYWYRGDLKKSEAFQQRSLAVREQAGNKRDVAGSLNNIGIVALQRGELNLAEKYLQRCYAIFEKMDNLQSKAFSLSNLAAVYIQRGELDRAKGYLQRSLALRKEYGNLQDIAEVRYQLIRILLMQERLEDATLQLEQLAKLAQSSKLPDISVKHSLSLGLLKLKHHELTSALNEGLKAKTQAESIPHFGLTVEAMEFLLQALLQLYLLTKKTEYKSRVEVVLQELEELSKREQLHSANLEVTLLTGFLKKADFDLAGAIRQFELAERLAEERGIRSLAQKARIELAGLHDQSSSFERLQKTSPRAYEQVHLESMVSFMQSLKGPITFDPSQLFMMVIRFAQRGPEVFLSENIPFSEDDPENLFAKASIFYSTAIGQGDALHQGLFGPLPLTESYSCLVYARLLPDAAQRDPRILGRTYALLCLAYPNGLDHFFTDRDGLAAIFENGIGKIKDISDINLQFLYNIRGIIVANSLKQPTIEI